MSTSYSIEGVREPDDRFREMLAIWEACKRAKVGVPEEVDEFFGYGTPDPNGIVNDLRGKYREWNNSDYSGLEIDLADIPPQIKTLRFVVSF